MTNDDIIDDDSAGGVAEAAAGLGSIALWKKALVVLSLLAGCVGLAMGGSAEPVDPVMQAKSASASGLVQPSGFNVGSLPGIGTQEGEETAEGKTIWAPLLAKGGLSFFVAFCIGYALRTFLKGTMLVVGVVALAVFGLQKAGILGEVNWDKAQGYWDNLTANVGEQFESLKTFVSGSLPSAASGTAGLFAGFRR